MDRHFQRRADSGRLLEQRFASAEISTLWFTGPCPGLEQKLLETSLPRTTIIRPGRDCEPDGFPDLQTLNLIAHYIAEHAVKHVIVWGQTGDVPNAVDARQSPGQGGTDSFARMIHRIYERLNRLRIAQDLVRTRFDRIRTHPGISQAIEERSVRLSAVFHIEETGAFLIFDHVAKEFVPLTIDAE
jgi:hypothetical protein